MARPDHKPTNKNRKLVESATGFGSTQKQIADALGIDLKTLRKHYRDELDNGAFRQLNGMAGALYRNGLKGNVAAQIFYLKTRGGWKATEDDGDDAPRSFEITVRPRPKE
jgi:hypothetical protein